LNDPDRQFTALASVFMRVVTKWFKQIVTVHRKIDGVLWRPQVVTIGFQCICIYIYIYIWWSSQFTTRNLFHEIYIIYSVIQLLV